MSPALKGVIVQGPAGGGLGKTLTVELWHATIHSRGETALLVDADIATASLSERLAGTAHLLTLRTWSGLAGEGARILHHAHVVGAEWVVVDLGASALALPEFDEFLAEMLDAATAAGAEAWMALAATPGKPGAPRELRRLLRAGLPAGVRSVIVQVDINGSHDFEGYGGLPADVPRARVPHIMPGLLGVRRLTPGSHLQAVLGAPEGHRRAAGMLARHLLEVCAQESWTRVCGPMGEGTTRALEQLAAAAPRHWYSGRATLADVTDGRLDADEAFLVSQARLDRLPAEADDAAVLSAARAYKTALDAMRGPARG